MATGNIKGITIELDGDTSGLQQALKKVDNETKSVQNELRQVDKLLKFDPSNVELLQQKQKLLGDAIDGTSKRLGALKQAQSEVERQFQSGEIGEEAYRKFQREIIATEGKLKAFQSQADSVKVKIDAQTDISGLDKMTDKLEEVSRKAQEVGGKMKDVGSEMSTKLSAPLAALGGGALLAAGQFDNAAGQIQAALGVTADEAAALEDKATSVWKAGFGESLDEVAGALVRVKQNIKDIDDGEVEKITQDSLALAKSFDSDVNEVTRAANNLMTNFGITSEEAFDMMANGAQKGLNFSNEMFDNVAEYAPLFADAGYSAEEMFTLLQKGAEKGIYNLDYLNDVVKEFGIRLTDGSDGTADALAALFEPEGFETFIGNLTTAGKKSDEFKELVKQVGLESATTMVEGLQKGGTTAEKTITAMQKSMGGYGDVIQGLQDGTITTSDAMEMIIGKLNEIEDPIERNTLGVQLFGTKWEDLGADVVLSLDGVKGALLETEGSMQSVTAAQEQTFGQRWETFVRTATASLEPLGKILLELAEQWLPKIIVVVEGLATWFSNLSPVMQGVTVAIGAIVAAIGPFLVVAGMIASAIGNLIPIFIKLLPAIKGAGVAIAGISAPVAIAIAAVTALIAIGVALYKNWDEVSAWLKKTWDTIKSNATSAFNQIKDSISKAWESVKSATSSVWESIKSALSIAWDSIKSTATSVFNSIKTSITSAFDAMKTTITNTWNTIKNFTSDVWNGIKGTVSTLVTGIYTAVNKKFTEMKTAVESKMGEVKTKIETKWSEAKSFLEGIDLLQIGKDIVSGLIKGIGDKFGSVRTKIEELAGMIPTWAKDVLGIKSPSRVMMEIGKWTGEGLALGIDDTQPVVKKAMEDLSGILIDVAENNIQQEKEIRKKADADILKLRNDAADKIADLEKKSSDKILGIQESASKKKKSMTAAQQRTILNSRKDTADKIIKIEEDTAAKIAKIESKAMSDSVKLLSTNQKELLKEIKLFISDKQSLEQMNLIQEAAIWEKSIGLFEEGTKERIEAQKAYQKSLETVNSQIVSTNQQYQTEIKKISDDLIKAEADLTKAYDDAVNNRANSLKSFAGTFDAFTVEVKQSGLDLTANLQSQVDGIKLWQEEFAKISSRGINGELLDELSELGVKALPELIALNQLTDEQLSQYSALYQEKAQLARTQAETELIGMKTDTQRKIDELRKAANAELTKLQTDWDTKIKGITQGTKTELSTLKQIGVDAGQGLLNGLASMQGPLIDKAREIANAISSVIQSALDIHSPSRVMVGFGVNIGEGLIVGMDNMISKVAQSSARLSDAMQNAQGSLASSAQRSRDAASGASNATSSSTTTTHVTEQHFHITISSPKALDPYESARLSKIALKEAGLQL